MRAKTFGLLGVAVLLSMGTAQAWETNLTSQGDKFYVNGAYFKMWGIRVASASQSDTYTNHLIAQLNDYKAHGVNTVTVFFMGSSGGCTDPFSSDGKSFRDSGHLNRMKRIIEECDSRGMVVIVGIFYQLKQVGSVNPSPQLSNWTACREAVKTVTTALTGYTNIVINIANEQNSSVYSDYPWKNVQNPDSIISLCRLVNQTDASRLVGGGGYDHTKNEKIGKSSDVDVLLWDTDSWSDNSKSLTDRFVAAGVTNKPMVNVELFGGVTKDVDNCGDFTSYKNYYKSEVDRAAANANVHVLFHANTWCQGPSVGCPLRFNLAGQGTASDIGIHWYFDYVLSKASPTPVAHHSSFNTFNRTSSLTDNTVCPYTIFDSRGRVVARVTTGNFNTLAQQAMLATGLYQVVRGAVSTSVRAIVVL